MAADNESRTSSPSRAATLRATEGLAASLRDNRAEVLRWKDEHPLRLVAAALLDMRRPAKKSDIGAKLAPEIISPDEWERWWSRIQPTMKESPHFSQNPRHEIRLRGKPSEIESPREPARRSEPVSNAPRAQDDKPRAAPSRSTALRLVDWITWVQSDEDGSTPALAPPNGLAAYLRRQPAILVPTSISKLSGAIEEKFLSATQSSRPSAEAWIDLLATSLDRCADLPADRLAPMSETVAFCARLTAELGANACQDITESLAKWTSASAENVETMANAILTSARRAPSETASLLQNLHDSLGVSSRKKLWTSLVTSDVGQVSDWLIGRWMRMMRDAEKSDMVSALILHSSDFDYVAHLNYLLNDERNGDDAPAHLFNPILMSWFLHRYMMPRIVQSQRERIQELREENERLRAEHRQEIAEKDRLISESDASLERAGKLERYLQGELRDAAHSATLSAGRDAVMILGGLLQDLESYRASQSGEYPSVKSRIELALLALGVKPFGEIGKIVPFESGVHEVNPPAMAGTPVRITAPGLAYFKDVETPQTIIRIQAQVEEQA